VFKAIQHFETVSVQFSPFAEKDFVQLTDFYIKQM
jgi:hypothetical protein